MIGHEERIEASTLQCLSKTLEMSKVEVGVTISAGITPSAGMDADRTHEGAKFELASSCHEELPIQDDPQNRPGGLSLSNNQTCRLMPYGREWWFGAALPWPSTTTARTKLSR